MSGIFQIKSTPFEGQRESLYFSNNLSLSAAPTPKININVENEVANLECSFTDKGKSATMHYYLYYYYSTLSKEVSTP